LKASGMGSIPICGNVFLQPIADSLHPQAMEAGQQNMNEKDSGLFSGDGKDSSSRCKQLKDLMAQDGTRQGTGRHHSMKMPINARANRVAFSLLAT